MRMSIQSYAHVLADEVGLEGRDLDARDAAGRAARAAADVGDGAGHKCRVYPAIECHQTRESTPRWAMPLEVT